MSPAWRAALAMVGCVLVAPRESVAQTSRASMRPGIEAALAASNAGWNAGDLDRFVAIYLDSARTTFATPKQYLHGRAEIRAHYAAHYFRPGVTRDSLRLEIVQVDSLGPDVANVAAFYILFRGDSTTARGPTSLLMQRIHGTWMIVHDHSS
jgi:uncharacterized protein (TIGR02246 family)